MYGLCIHSFNIKKVVIITENWAALQSTVFPHKWWISALFLTLSVLYYCKKFKGYFIFIYFGQWIFIYCKLEGYQSSQGPYSTSSKEILRELGLFSLVKRRPRGNLMLLTDVWRANKDDSTKIFLVMAVDTARDSCHKFQLGALCLSN